jgi:hypothetical protein
LRTHPDGGKLGDPWTWCCTVTPDPADPKLAVIHGVERRPNRLEFLAFEAALRDAGFTGRRHERRRGRGVEHVRKPLRPPVSADTSPAHPADSPTAGIEDDPPC